jgi:hypothetical protein
VSVDAPAGIVAVSIGVNGPAAEPAKPPVAELVENVTLSGAVDTCTLTGVEAPAANEAGVLVTTSCAAEPPPPPPAGGGVAGVDHVENVCQFEVKAAPSTLVVHQLGAHAAAPGSVGSTGVNAVSWIAPAIRSSTACVCAL